ncbi:unnamed protein product [Durusdinium trenchii]|uniref:Importin subunit beta-1/Transportin-1-like TPR repeats domain-containing protein n=1 Tax=Durusdinium trenchii TaxID=1381693 RepID=A0ABP0K0D7_9DINO
MTELDVAHFLRLLELLRCPDNSTRSDAEKRYVAACQTDPAHVFACLAHCLAHHDDVIRIQAATLLRRAATVATGPEDPWPKAVHVHAAIRINLIKAIARESCSPVRRTLVAAIAVISEAGPWPELVPMVFDLANENVEAAICLLGELVGRHVEEIMSHSQTMSIIHQGLTSKTLAASAIVLVSQIVGAHQGELKWKTGVASALQQVLPQLEGALALLTEEQSPNLPEALQALIMLAEHQPSFFKSRYQIWIEIMLKLALSPVHPSVRMLSFEWVASLVASAKGLVKAVPDLPSKALTVAFLFLSELEEDEEAERLCKEGEAKVDFLVKNFTFNVAKSPLASLTLRYARSPSWKERTAAALAIRAAGEYADEISADQMTEALLQLTTDPHCRVGSAAFFALGQLCHDRGSNFNQEWCEKFMPAFARGCQEKEVLIARKAIGALESHLHQCSSHEISRFSSMLVNVLVLKLQSSDTNIVVAALEALGALAIAVDDGFDDCYDSLAPLLLRALESTSKDHIHSTIREKAFECISLMGFAVTKEKFAPLAAAALKSLAPKRESDVIDASIDVCELSDCSRDSIQRMCKVLGVDFGHFLPLLVPSILGSLDQLEAFTTDIQGAEDDLVVQLDTSTFRVRTGQLTEAVALIKLLEVLMKHTAECFLQFVLPTSRVLVKLLSQSPSVFTSELREGIYPTWAELVSLKGLDLETKRILVQSFVEKLALDIMNSEEADDIASMARALALIIDRARHEDGTLPGATAQVTAQQVTDLCGLAVSEIAKSFQREGAGPVEGETSKRETSWSGSDEEEEGDDEDENEEHQCRTGLLSIITSCMKADPQAFLSSAWPSLLSLLQQWFGKPRGAGGTKLALRLACEICHLGEDAASAWPTFMTQVVVALSSDREERRWAARGVAWAARSEAFAPWALPAAERLRPRELRSDGEIAALVQLCLSHSSALADTCSDCWRSCFAALPLKADLAESRRLNNQIFAQVESGAIQGISAARAVGYLSEVLGLSRYRAVAVVL